MSACLSGNVASDLCTSQKIKSVLGKAETFDLEQSHEEPDAKDVQEELDLFELSKSNLNLVTVMSAFQVFKDLIYTFSGF